ncbi:hypothetical protein [Actinomadura gamaensis]|uniref:Integral membrane protein n=1 Tax=Actinomadura gamaensis TaxID=1763541 RepID=A0ABV9U5E9_9ACTN
MTALRVLLGFQVAFLALPGVLLLIFGCVLSRASLADPETVAILKLLLVAGIVLTVLALVGTALTVTLPRSRDAQYFAIVYEVVLGVVCVYPVLLAFVIPVLHLFTVTLALAITIVILLIRHVRTK